MKKAILTLVLVGVFTLAACDSGEVTEDVDSWEVAYEFSYDEISEWDPMVTPGGEDDQGSVDSVDDDSGFVSIKAGPNGWGGLQTPALEVDMTRNPFLFVQVYESEDGFNWGAQTIIDDQVGDEWALYVISDNGLKWNHYAGGSIADGVGNIYDEYGENLDLRFWVYPTGGEEATVEISSIKIVYMD